MAPQPFPARDQVAAIIVGTATATIVNEDLVEGTQQGEIYFGPGNALGIPNQDLDSDLIPDEGQTPLPPFDAPIVNTFTDKRTPVVP